MEPQIMHGDIVVLQRKDDWSSANGSVSAVRLNDGITLKRIKTIIKVHIDKSIFI